MNIVTILLFALTYNLMKLKINKINVKEQNISHVKSDLWNIFMMVDFKVRKNNKNTQQKKIKIEF